MFDICLSPQTTGAILIFSWLLTGLAGQWVFLVPRTEATKQPLTTLTRHQDLRMGVGCLTRYSG